MAEPDENATGDVSRVDESPWDDAELILLGRTRDGVTAVVFAHGAHEAHGEEAAPDAHAQALVELGRRPLARSELPAWVARREAGGRDRGRPVRWVWSSTPAWYPRLLESGVRVARCRDLRLCRAILREALTGAADSAGEDTALGAGWDASPDDTPTPQTALFDLDDGIRIDDLGASLAELARQETRLNETRTGAAGGTPSGPDRARLRLLLAAESAGALIATELRSAGLPWSRTRHEELLTAELGMRVAGGTPSNLVAQAALVREALGDETASLDSPPRLLRALRRSGLDVASTSKWELADRDHPVVAPLLEYKRLMRLYTANGWAWLDEWVRDGRFRPVYVPGGVVTGRWASSGGGALQLPRALRDAVRADPGWVIVDADVAQLEPRVLAAMARDERMADAARGRDLYEGVVSSGVAADREEAKYAMLGALYGATTGESARLVPRLRRAFPRAMGMVDHAAATGENAGRVVTWLGRTSPDPGGEWRERQQRASAHGASPADERMARSAARDWGRFTRNFIVQGTAAEWALAWMADLRRRLSALPDAEKPAPRSGTAFSRKPHLAFFLHDEVIVHAPAEQAEEVADAVRASAESAGRLLFGSFPIDFPLDIRIGRSAAK